MEIAKRLLPCLVAFLFFCPGPVFAAEKLNVLFIAVDDLNNALGCYGKTLVKTPNLDRLAERGVRFDRAYCQYPVCNPSRASFLSGLRPLTTGILDNKATPREQLKDTVFLPQLFRQHGYFSVRVGKIFHDGDGFDDLESWDISETGQGSANLKVIRERHVQRGENTRNKYYHLPWKIVDAQDEETSDGIVAHRAAGFIEQAVKETKPFFIAAGFRKPHHDFIAPKKYFDLYDPDKIPLPNESADHLKNIPRAALNYAEKDLPPLTDADTREVIAAYYACISFVDAQVGVLMETMDRLKLWDNTIVVFFGDHGFHLGEHGGLWQKGTLFEEVARVPLVVAAPKAKKGGVSPRIVELVDLYPTLAEACGLPAPAGLEGKSFVPLLSEPNRPWEKVALTSVRGATSLRTERYRFTQWPSGETELYDHDHDPNEYVNLALHPKHAETISTLKKLLREHVPQAADPARKTSP